MRRYCLTLDLKDDPKSISAYIGHHQKVWPQILDSIKASGINGMEIYHVSNRLFMMIEVSDDFCFDRKARMDFENAKVQEWEMLMDKYQSRLPFAKPDEKWVLMDKIFDLNQFN